VNDLRFGFVVANVKDVVAARHFYENVLGLTVQREAPNFIQFENFAVASDNPDATAPLELYWLVDDIERARDNLTSRGADCTDIDQKPFGSLFSTTDPDGGQRFVLQLAAQRPSTAV